MKELFAKSLNIIHQFIENFDEFDFFRKDAIEFESALITLCFFCIGGQKREFIANFTLNVSKKY